MLFNREESYEDFEWIIESQSQYLFLGIRHEIVTESVGSKLKQLGTKIMDFIKSMVTNLKKAIGNLKNKFKNMSGGGDTDTKVEISGVKGKTIDEVTGNLVKVTDLLVAAFEKIANIKEEKDVITPEELLAPIEDLMSEEMVEITINKKSVQSIINTLASVQKSLDKANGYVSTINAHIKVDKMTGTDVNIPATKAKLLNKLMKPLNKINSCSSKLYNYASVKCTGSGLGNGCWVNNRSWIS